MSWKNKVAIAWWTVGWIVILALSAAMLFGCRTTKVVEVEKVRTDTAYVAKVMRDSVVLRDSVSLNVYQKGDTVFWEKSVWHTDIQERWRVDTVYKAKVDSVPVAYPVVKTVPAELNAWQKARMRIGEGAIALVLIGGGIWYFRHK